MRRAPSGLGDVWDRLERDWEAQVLSSRPSYRIARDVRTFQVVPDQAPEGRQRRQARGGLHQDRARDHASPRARAAATPTPTTGCAWRWTRRARRTCPPTTSSAPSRRRPAARRPSSTRRSSTRATARAAWRSSSRRPPTTRTARRPTCAPCSPRPAASWPAADAVAWQFEPRGVIAITRDGRTPDDVALAAIDAGADDVDTEGDPLEIVTEPGSARGDAQGARGGGRAGRVGRGRRCRPRRRSRSTCNVARQNLRLIENARGPRRRPARDRQLRPAGRGPGRGRFRLTSWVGM